MKLIISREYCMGVDPGYGNDIKVASLFKRNEDGCLELVEIVREKSTKKFEKKIEELKVKYNLDEN